MLAPITHLGCGAPKMTVKPGSEMTRDWRISLSLPSIGTRFAAGGGQARAMGCTQNLPKAKPGSPSTFRGIQLTPWPRTALVN